MHAAGRVGISRSEEYVGRGASFIEQVIHSTVIKEAAARLWRRHPGTANAPRSV